MEYTKIFDPKMTEIFQESICCWDNIPGSDNVKFTEYLKLKYDIDWMEKAKIEKFDKNKIINVHTDENSLSLRLNKKNKAILSINNIIMDEFNVIEENGKLNLYQNTSQMGVRMGDRCNRSVYVYNERIILAVNVAIVTGRPLLVRGPSGCGKSSLAQNVAKTLGCPYLKQVISSRTQARDLLYEVDLLHRLQDAQMKKLKPNISAYIKPGIIWWAFDPNDAKNYDIAPTSDIFKVPSDKMKEKIDYPKAVILLDEIDKADPDVPNNLLDPIGSLQFQVEEIKGKEVQCKENKRPLIIITTNDERELPPAFLRRCVELKIENPLLKEMLEIGKAQFPSVDLNFLENVAVLLKIPASDKESHKPSEISPAEYIDTVKACVDLEIRPDSKEWKSVTEITMWKHGRASR